MFSTRTRATPVALVSSTVQARAPRDRAPGIRGLECVSVQRLNEVQHPNEEEEDPEHARKNLVGEPNPHQDGWDFFLSNTNVL